MGKHLKGMFGSTEPEARKVVEGIESRRNPPKKKPKDTGGKTTAKSPKGVQRTKKEGEQSKKDVRKRIAKKIAEAQAKEKANAQKRKDKEKARKDKVKKKLKPKKKKKPTK